MNYKYRCRNPQCPQREAEVLLAYPPGEYRKIKGTSPICESCGDGLWYIHPKREKCKCGAESIPQHGSSVTDTAWWDHTRTECKPRPRPRDVTDSDWADVERRRGELKRI